MQGAGAESEIVLEAMLSYWLSWYVLPTGRADGINPYVFPLAIWLVRGEKLALTPIFLSSLFFRLDECVRNLLKSMGRVYSCLLRNFFSIIFMGEI